jgi:hypothetical protein
MNIEQELKKFFEKQSESIYEEDIKKLKQNIENKNYAVYMEKCQSTLSEIQIHSLSECYENLEKRMKQRIVELDQIEEKFKNLSNFSSFPSEQHIQDLNNLTVMNNFLTENITHINTAMESLENDYLDSIKKMKKTYENREKDSIIQLLLKSYKEKRIRIIELLKIKTEKERILFEKSETLKANSEKVAKCEAEYEQTKDNYNQVFLSQQFILDEIQQMQQNFKRNECEINYLENSLCAKNISSNLEIYSLVNGRIFRNALRRKERRYFSLRLRDNDPLRNLKNDIATFNQQYENIQMMNSEYMSSVNKSRAQKFDKVKRDYNNFIGLVIYNKYLRLKMERVLILNIGNR